MTLAKLSREMSKRLTIRTAALGDAEVIAEVQVSAWKDAYRGMLPNEALDALTVDERAERWTEILQTDSRNTLVAERDDKLVGWIGFGVSRDDNRNEQVCEVYGLYVSPSHWRSGAGSALWSAACDRLSEDGFATLDVWALEANERARRFYESMGCTFDASAKKMFERDGIAVPEVRYSLKLT